VDPKNIADLAALAIELARDTIGNIREAAAMDLREAARRIEAGELDVEDTKLRARATAATIRAARDRREH
jgi:NaMN:DMB phosphoribosyltransferase